VGADGNIVVVEFHRGFLNGRTIAFTIYIRCIRTDHFNTTGAIPTGPIECARFRRSVLMQGCLIVG
jgi:hypothetical protein